MLNCTTSSNLLFRLLLHVVVVLSIFISSSSSSSTTFIIVSASKLSDREIQHVLMDGKGLLNNKNSNYYQRRYTNNNNNNNNPTSSLSPSSSSSSSTSSRIQKQQYTNIRKKKASFIQDDNTIYNLLSKKRWFRQKQQFIQQVTNQQQQQSQVVKQQQQQEELGTKFTFRVPTRERVKQWFHNDGCCIGSFEKQQQEQQEQQQEQQQVLLFDDNNNNNNNNNNDNKNNNYVLSRTTLSLKNNPFNHDHVGLTNPTIGIIHNNQEQQQRKIMVDATTREGKNDEMDNIIDTKKKAKKRAVPSSSSSTTTTTTIMTPSVLRKEKRNSFVHDDDDLSSEPTTSIDQTLPVISLRSRFQNRRGQQHNQQQHNQQQKQHQDEEQQQHSSSSIFQHRCNSRSKTKVSFSNTSLNAVWRKSLRHEEEQIDGKNKNNSFKEYNEMTQQESNLCREKESDTIGTDDGLHKNNNIDIRWWPSSAILPSEGSKGGILSSSPPSPLSWRVRRYRKTVGYGIDVYNACRDAALNWEFQSDLNDKGMLFIDNTNNDNMNNNNKSIKSNNNPSSFVVEDECDTGTNSNVQQIWSGPGRRLVTYTSSPRQLPDGRKLRKWIPSIYAINPVQIVYDLVDQRGYGTTYTSTAYGTLHGHALCGEERVTVCLRDTNNSHTSGDRQHQQHQQAVDIEILSYSKPNTKSFHGKLLWPFIGKMQDNFFLQQLNALEKVAKLQQTQSQQQRQQQQHDIVQTQQ